MTGRSAQKKAAPASPKQNRFRDAGGTEPMQWRRCHDAIAGREPMRRRRIGAPSGADSPAPGNRHSINLANGKGRLTRQYAQVRPFPFPYQLPLNWTAIRKGVELTMEGSAAIAAPGMPATTRKPTGIRYFFKQLYLQRALVIMSVPFVIWLFIFRYLPLWGWVIAFQNYKPARSFSEQQWVGFAQFEFLFTDERFFRVLRNTLVMSFENLILGFVTAITLALLLNEVRQLVFKRVVQTIS